MLADYHLTGVCAAKHYEIKFKESVLSSTTHYRGVLIEAAHVIFCSSALPGQRFCAKPSLVCAQFAGYVQHQAPYRRRGIRQRDVPGRAE